VYSPLLPRPGQPPVKVIFDNLAHGADGDALYAAHSGAIGQFVQGQRQNAESGVGGFSKTHKDLPGGGRYEYSTNGGQEVVRVKLTQTLVHPQRETTEQVQKGTPTLLIDVIFDPELYISGDVFSYQQSGTGSTEPGQGYIDFPIAWTQHVIQTHASVEAYYRNHYNGSPGVGNGEYITDYHEIRTGQFDGIPFAYNQNGQNGWVEGVNSPGQVPIAESPPRTALRVSDFVYVSISTRRDTTLGFVAGSSSAVWLLNIWDAPGGVTRSNARDQTSYFDFLNVVGLIGDPDKKPYTAISTGAHDNPKLLALTQAPAGVSIVRAIAPSSVPPGTIGVGFLAKPTTALHPGGKPGVTVIDVYVASENSIKANTFPGGQDLVFSTDDPSFTYSVKRDLRMRVRVRELINGESPFIVRVAPLTTRRVQHFSAPEQGAVSFPSLPDTPVDNDAGRDASWKFGAQSRWIDNGREPADGNTAAGAHRSNTGGHPAPGVHRGELVAADHRHDQDRTDRVDSERQATRSRHREDHVSLSNSSQ
jgi:hypothetical protein